MKKIVYIVAAVGLLITSCAKEESVEQPYDGALKITSGIATRAIDQTWESGDTIGVTMYNADSTTECVGKANTPYATTSTTATADFKVVSPAESLYYPQADKVDIFAYYPYSAASVTDFALDVTDQSDLPAIDLMTSVNATDKVKSKESVDLEFKHKLSKMVVTLTPKAEGGLVAEDLADAKVTISGARAKASYNLLTDAVDFGSNEAADIAATAVTSVASFIVIPQQVTTPIFTITVGGSDFEVKMTSDATFAAGKQNNYTISVSRTESKLEGATINEWGAGEDDELDADDYNEPEK